MKTYTIRYTETIVYEFEVEAETPEEAYEEFDRMGIDGELDFSHGYITDTETEIIDEE